MLKQKLNYVCEKNSKIRKINKYKFKDVKWIKDENIIFKDKNIDLVVISSYDNYHFRQIKKSLKNKKSVFLRKTNLSKFKPIKRIRNLLIKYKSNKFSSNLILRSNKEFKFLKKLIIKKKLEKFIIQKETIIMGD